MLDPMASRTALLLWLAVGCGGGARAGDAGSDTAPDGVAPSLAVLFVGNSYTYFSDLPAEIAAMTPADVRVVPTSIALGGAALRDHWAGEARAAIEGGGHDVVVLQGQSVEPLTNPDDFAQHADLLAGAAQAAGARVVFYGTWARRAGDPFYADERSGGSPAAMQDGLTAGYAGAADRNHAGLTAVGEGFRIVLAEHAEIELFDPDGSHPSTAGTYLAAAALVEGITALAPTDVARLGLDAPTRAILRDAGHRALRPR